MLAINLLIINMVILINTEISMFFVSIFKTQKLMNEYLLKTRNYSLFPNLENAIENNINVKAFLSEMENKVQENDLVFSKQRRIFTKVVNIIRFIKIFEFIHQSSIINIDKVFNENEIILNEIKSVIEQYIKYSTYMVKLISVRSLMRRTYSGKYIV